MCDIIDIELKLREDGEPPAKKSAPTIRLGAGFKWNLQALANAADAVESGGKSPVSALNELGVRVNYSVLRQGGPAHCPSFTVAVTVADMTFEGWGHSKREARASAARACLAALLARAGRVLPAPGANQNQDFTSDEMGKVPVSDFQCLEVKMKPAPPPSVTTVKSSDSSPEGTPPPAPCPATALFGASSAATVHKSPINVLYENYPGIIFNCTFGDGSPLDSCQAPLQLSHSMRFKVVCCIKDQKFEGYGSSKKLAKLAAARSALAVLDEGRVDSPPSTATAGFLPQTLADHVGKLVNEKFNEVMKGDLVHSKRKVLAGIVITVNNRTEDARVIAVTTGTKCVSGEHMSVRGRVLNDCHAEVAARRCLQRHLYAQLLMYAQAKDPKTPIPDNDLEPLPTGGYQLKPDRQVHLYVSTAPCGDGRIFSPHEQPEPEPDRHPNRLARGQLRTKIESGEGTIPVKNSTNVVQTWDGVLQGERLLTMSCSDKVARWCVVGLQGALLSRIMKPVYLHSLVLGSLLHPHHMYRALCGRIEAYISSLPPPFQLKPPLLARAASTEARTPARAPSFSVSWCSTTQLPEIVNATTGKLESGQPSLLCKQSMFARWQYLVKRLPLLPQEDNIGVEPVKMPADLEHILYNEAKQLCPTYQVAKERLIEAFDKAKLGRWVKKPLEQDQFACEVADAPTHALFAWAGPALSDRGGGGDRWGREGEGSNEECGEMVLKSEELGSNDEETGSKSGDDEEIESNDEEDDDETGSKSRDDDEKGLESGDGDNETRLDSRYDEKASGDEYDVLNDRSHYKKGLESGDESEVKELMASKNLAGKELRNKEVKDSVDKGVKRDKTGEKKVVRFQDSYKEYDNSDCFIKNDKDTLKNSGSYSGVKHRSKITVGDRLRRFALGLDKYKHNSYENDLENNSKEHKNDDTRKSVDRVDAISKATENKCPKTEPSKMSAYYIKNNNRQVVNLEEKLKKNNEFIKTKKLKTDLHIDKESIRVSVTEKLTFDRNSYNTYTLSDVYTKYKNDPLNFDTETLENEVDEIYQSVFGEIKTEAKNNVVKEEEMNLGDSVSPKTWKDSKTDEDQSYTYYKTETTSVLSETNNDSCTRRNLHLSYLMTRFKNIKLQNDNNSNKISVKTENMQSESEKGQESIVLQNDSKPINRFLLYDSKVRNSMMNSPPISRFFPSTNKKTNKDTIASEESLPKPDISMPQPDFYTPDSASEDSYYSHESFYNRADSLQISNCSSQKTESNLQSKFLLKKLQMLKNIKDVT